MVNYHTVRATSAADITLPRSGLYLVSVRTIGTTTPGAWQYRYGKSAGQATFCSPSNGTRGRKRYSVNHQINGTVIPSGAQTFTGGISSVELIFADAPNTDPAAKPLSSFVAILLRRVDAGAVSAAISVSFDVAPATPREAETYISASAGRVTYASNDNLTPQLEAICTELGAETMPAPTSGASNSIAPTVTTDAAATIQQALYYDPALPGALA
jgi:hypothetical protein